MENEEEILQTATEPVRNLPQYIAACASTLFLLVAGTVLAWSSPALPILKAVNSTLLVTEDEETWIVSLMPLGGIIGTYPGGVTADLIGRKFSLLIVGVLALFSWVIIAAAQTAAFLYVARFLAGIALGWGMTVQPIYIGEISTPNVRGALGMVGQIQICFGSLYVLIIGPCVSHVLLAILSAVLVIFFLLSIFWMPETPYFLLLKNDQKGAIKILKKLRGQTELGINQELHVWQMDVEETNKNKGSWKELFTNRGNLRAVNIIFWLMTLQQFTGATAVFFYSQSIFDKAETGLSPSMCAIAVGVVMTVVSFIIPYLVEKLGRRPLIVITTFIMGISLICMGYYYYLNHNKYHVATLTWLPLSSIMIFCTANSIGLGPVPWVMISEFFAPNVRAHGATLSSATSWLMIFIVTKLFQPLEAMLNTYGIFWFFATISMIGVVFSHFCIPETKGKTLQEIQIMLNSRHTQ